MPRASEAEIPADAASCATLPFEPGTTISCRSCWLDSRLNLACAISVVGDFRFRFHFSFLPMVGPNAHRGYWRLNP
jgi:hypothetical protein